MCRNGKTAIVEMNRNIIGKLLAITAKSGKVVDFEAALAYTHTSTPLSLSNPDGSRRVTQKSKLVEVMRLYQDDPGVQSDVIVRASSCSTSLLKLEFSRKRFRKRLSI